MTTIVPDPATANLEPAHPPVYDRPIALKQLYADPGTGAEHYVVRYPAGLRTLPHTHTAAHTLIVIDGLLDVDGTVLGPGGYAHHPAGTPMRHEPSGPGGCTFVIVFDGPFDVEPVLVD